MPMRNMAFIDPRVASEVREIEGLAVDEVLLLAIDEGVVLEAVTVLEAMFEPEDSVDFADELAEALNTEEPIPFDVPFSPEWE